MKLIRLVGLLALLAFPALAQNPAPTSGGLLNSSVVAAASTNSTNVKATFGQVFALSLGSVSSSAAYLKLYDKATAPTCGTDTPVARFPIPSLTTGGVSNVAIPYGMSFFNGIGYCLTNGIADSNSGSVAASGFTVNIWYK